MSNLDSFSEAPPADMLGGLLIGVFIALMYVPRVFLYVSANQVRLTFSLAFIRLFGVTIVQTYVYFLRCSGDPRWTKSLVVAVW